MESWWDVLPLEIQAFILELRDKMYVDNHKIHYLAVVNDLETIGTIKATLKVEFVKVVVPSRKRCARAIVYPESEICPRDNRIRRRVTAYFKASDDVTREIRVACCICQVTEDSLRVVKSRIQTEDIRCRIPLFYDEWRDPYFYRGRTRLTDPCKVAYLREKSKKRKEKNEQTD